MVRAPPGENLRLQIVLHYQYSSGRSHATPGEYRRDIWRAVPCAQGTFGLGTYSSNHDLLVYRFTALLEILEPKQMTRWPNYRAARDAAGAVCLHLYIIGPACLSRAVRRHRP